MKKSIYVFPFFHTPHYFTVLLLFFCIVFSGSSVSAQNVSNMGKEFWLGFMQNNGNAPTLTLRISAKNPTNGTVSNPLTGFSLNFTVAAGTVTTVNIPTAYAAAGTGVQNKGLKVTANDTITLFASNFQGASFDATPVIPVEAWGYEYRAMTYFPVGTSGAEFLIVAKENNTQVTIAPQTSSGPIPAFNVTLNAGQVYQYQNLDLTGTHITAANCKPFAMFSGSVCSFVPATCYACDHLYEQFYPVNTWGRSFIATPFVRTVTNTMRILTSEDSTTVNVGGTVALIPTAGTFIEANFPTAMKVTADKPVQLAQYAQSLSCSGAGDPFMLSINPMEQRRTSLIYSSIASAGIDTHYVNVVISSAATATVKLNGVAVPASKFLPVPTDLTQSFAQLVCQSGTNTLSADSLFNAYVYGFGNTSFESYGYSGGSNVNPLLKIEAICRGDSFELTAPPGASYLWSTGQTTRKIVVLPSSKTTYTVTVTNNCIGIIYNYTLTPQDPAFNYSQPTYCKSAANPVPSITGTPGGAFSSSPPGLVFVSTSTGEVDLAASSLGTYSVTYKTPGPCPVSRTVSLQVAEDAKIQLTSAAGTDNQELCAGTALDQIVYKISGGGTGGTVTGLPPGVTGSFSNGNYTISGSPTAAGTYSYTVNTTGSCKQTSASGTITVKPDATLTLTSGAGSNAQVICQGAGLNNITYAVGGGGTNATVSGLPAGITGNFSGGVLTISGSSSVTGVFTYTVTTTGDCAQKTESGKITVNPDATITLTSAVGTDKQQLCNGQSLVTITYAVGGGGTGAGVTGLPPGTSGTFAGGIFTISGLPTSAGSFPYTVTTTGTCRQVSAAGSAVIHPLPVINATAVTDETACAAKDGSISINASGTGLKYSIDGGLTFQSSGIFSGLASGSYPVVVENAFGCRADGGTVSISSAGAPPAPEAIASPNPLCSGEDLTLSVKTPSAGEVYTWSGPAGYSATGPVQTITSVSEALSGLYTVTASVGGCISPGGFVQVKVNPNAAITLTSPVGSDSQQLCVNTPVSAISYQLSGGATSASVTGLPSGLSGALAGGIFTITGSSADTGQFSYTVTTAGTCSQVAASGTIQLNPDARLFLISAAGSDNQVPCVNTQLTDITYGIAGGAVSATATGLPAGISQSFSGTTLTISGTPSSTGNFPYTVSTSGTCQQASLNGNINVATDAAVTLLSPAGTDQASLCISTALVPIQYTVSGGGTGATVSGLPPGITGTYASGIFTISGTPSDTGLFAYTVTTTGNCAQAVISGTIRVLPDATLLLTSAAGSDDQSICLNDAIALLTYTFGGGATGAFATGLPPGLNGNQSGNTFTISGFPTALGAITFTITTTGTCAQKSATARVTIYNNAAISLTSPAGSDAQSVCINTPLAPVTYLITGGGTGGTVTGLPPGLQGQFSGGVFTITGTPTTTGTFSYTVQTTGFCLQTSASGSITVNPDATLALTSAAGSDNQSLCINTVIKNITYATGGGATSATVTGLPQGITSVFSNNTLRISGKPTVAGSFPYQVTTVGTCQQKVLGGQIVVNPIPDVGVNSPRLCNGDTATLTATGATTYTWSGGISVAGAHSVNVSPSQTTSYTVTGSSAGCVDSATALVTVDPPVVVTVVADTICRGETAMLLATGADSYLWNTGSSANPLTVSPAQTTIYSVTGTRGNCQGISSSAVVVKGGPVVNSEEICEGDTAYLEVSGNQPFQWSNGMSGPRITVSPVQTMVYTVLEDGCSIPARATVTVFPAPVATITAPQRTTLTNPQVNYRDQSLVSGGQEIISWQWLFTDTLSQENTSGLQHPYRVYTATGRYCATLVITTDKGCVDSTIHCLLVEPEFFLFIPTSFTPNNDGINDLFMPDGERALIRKFEMKIFDRWGQEVFSTADPEQGWDGRHAYTNEEVMQGVYSYMVTVTDFRNSKNRYSGRVVLLR